MSVNLLTIKAAKSSMYYIQLISYSCQFWHCKREAMFWIIDVVNFVNYMCVMYLNYVGRIINIFVSVVSSY